MTALRVLALLLVARAAFADPLAIDTCPAPTGDEPSRRALAATAYDRGDVLYVQGDYAGAIAAFVESYCALPYYTVLKDIGQAYERKLEYAHAIAYLERYVASVPEDATRVGVCAPEPAADRRNVAARIAVLAALPARVSVASTPAGADVTLRRGPTVVARATAGAAPIEVRAGAYEMTVEAPGYVPQTLPIVAEIGMPQSHTLRLEPRRGALRVRVVPADARVFVDDRFVGIGGIDESLPGGRYELMVEAPGRLTERRLVLIAADTTESLTVRLAAPARSGRGQLLAATSIGGGVLGGTALAVAGGEGTLGAVGALIGLGLGGVGGYLAIDPQIREGESSLIITAGLVGATEGALAASLAGAENDAAFLAGTIGLVGGATAGVLGAGRLAPSAGDAALIGSGALWGTTMGALFAAAFDPDAQVASAIVLSGLNAGVLTGALLGRRFEASRRHVALIDLAGLGGAIAATALQTIVEDGSATSAESRANFAIAGVASGLLVGTYLTRNLDAPGAAPPRVTPSVQPAAGGAVFGVTGSY